MFRAFSGEFCCSVDQVASTFIWRVARRSDESSVLAEGSADNSKEAINAVLDALKVLKEH